MAADKKAQLRAALLASRRAVSDAVRSAEAVALATQAETIVNPDDTVCAYVPVGTEPGSPDLLERLRERCARLLLPVVSADTGPLLWGEYVPGTLAIGRFGLPQPTGSVLPPSALAEAAVVFVPALAVDLRGVRLGRGGGFYDRSLVFCARGSKLVAVVRDGEVVDELPSEPHDIRMSHALTPGFGVTALNGSNPV